MIQTNETIAKGSVTGVFSELNEYRSSIRTVSDQYSHICVELIQIRIYKSVSDPLPECFVFFFFGSETDFSRMFGCVTSADFRRCLPPSPTMLSVCTKDELGAMTPLSLLLARSSMIC